MKFFRNVVSEVEKAKQFNTVVSPDLTEALSAFCRSRRVMIKEVNLISTDGSIYATLDNQMAAHCYATQDGSVIIDLDDENARHAVYMGKLKDIWVVLAQKERTPAGAFSSADKLD